MITKASFNLVGGRYSNSLDAAVSRVTGVTSSWINPAGLATEKSSSISSGASAYSYSFNNQNNRKTFSTSSSTSHVAMAKATKNYILAFMLYTSFDQKLENSISSYKKNNEGYTQGLRNSLSTDLNQNIYIFSMAKRNSNWGLSLNITQTSSSISTTQSSQNYSSTPSERKFKNFSYQTENQEYMLSLALGQKFRINDNFQFAYKLTSPKFLLYGTGNYSMDYLFSEGKGPNDSTLVSLRQDSKSKTVYAFEGEQLRLGLSYQKNKHNFEIDLNYSSGYLKSKSKFLSDGDTTYWTSQTDTYGEEKSETYNSEQTPGHNSANLSFGYEYQFDKDNSMAYGFTYNPTTEKSGKGMNTLMLSGGFTQRYKNFVGSYGVNYQRGFDTGKNTSYDDNLEKEVEAKEEFEAINILVSGAYYF